MQITKSTSGLASMAFLLLAASFFAAPSIAATLVAPSDVGDRPVAIDPAIHEVGAAIANRPNAPGTLVAARIADDNGGGGKACVVYRSTNNGSTWTLSGPLPLLTGATCIDVELLFSPNGSRLYAATIEKDWDAEPGSVVVSVSLDGGLSWTATEALPSTPAEPSYSGLSLAVGQRNARQNDVYLATVGRNDAPDFLDLLVVHSTDGGVTWSGPSYIDWMNVPAEHGWIGEPNLAGGTARELMVAWSRTTDAGAEGWRHEVRVARSTDGGESFSAPVTAASRNRPWSPTEIAPKIVMGWMNGAHIVYSARNPNAHDEGDIYYTQSVSPYTAWSTPVVIDGAPAGKRAQAPSLVATRCGSASVLNVIWSDDRLYTPPSGGVARYDIFYSRKLDTPGNGWSPAVRISNASSPSWDLHENAVTGLPTRVFAMWTDKRDGGGSSAGDLDLYASRINSGITCP